MGSKRKPAVELTDWVAERDRQVAARAFTRPADKPLTKNHLRYMAAIRANPVTLAVGPAGCLHPETPIRDPVTGTVETVATRAAVGTPFHVTALDESTGRLVVAKAEAPREFPAEPMLRFTLRDGRTITVTAGHRFWTGDRYVEARDIADCLRVFGVVRLPTSSAPGL